MTHGVPGRRGGCRGSWLHPQVPWSTDPRAKTPHRPLLLPQHAAMLTCTQCTGTVRHVGAAGETATVLFRKGPLKSWVCFAEPLAEQWAAGARAPLGLWPEQITPAGYGGIPGMNPRSPQPRSSGKRERLHLFSLLFEPGGLIRDLGSFCTTSSAAGLGSR